MAFTVEHEDDQTEITILDDTGDDFDVNVILSDGLVYLRQTNPFTNKVDLITLTDTMYAELMAAYNSPEGMHNGQRFRIQET